MPFGATDVAPLVDRVLCDDLGGRTRRPIVGDSSGLPWKARAFPARARSVTRDLLLSQAYESACDKEVRVSDSSFGFKISFPPLRITPSTPRCTVFNLFSQATQLAYLGVVR